MTASPGDTSQLLETPASSEDGAPRPRPMPAEVAGKLPEAKGGAPAPGQEGTSEASLCGFSLQTKEPPSAISVALLNSPPSRPEALPVGDGGQRGSQEAGRLPKSSLGSRITLPSLLLGDALCYGLGSRPAARKRKYIEDTDSKQLPQTIKK